MTRSEDTPLWIAAPRCGRDACFSLPAVRALAARRPVTLVCHENQAFLWRAASLDEVRPVADAATKRTAVSAFADAPEILLWEPGVLADAAVRAKVPQRIGPDNPRLAKRLTRPIQRDDPPGAMQHVVRFYLGLASELGCDPFDSRFFAPLAAPETRGDSLILSPGSSFGSHFEWPLERWSELLESIRPLHAAIQVLADRPDIAAWAESHELPVINAADAPEALVRCRSMIAAESPWPHFAGAFGATCAVLYGPGEPVLHRPLGRQHIAVRQKAECAPCFAAKCLMDLRCQRELSVERVFQAVRPLIS